MLGYFSDEEANYGCPAYIMFKARIGGDITNNVTDWESCSQICRTRTECKYWTWHMRTHPKAHLRLKCYTMIERYDKIWKHYNSYSGDRQCGFNGNLENTEIKHHQKTHIDDSGVELKNETQNEILTYIDMNSNVVIVENISKDCCKKITRFCNRDNSKDVSFKKLYNCKITDEQNFCDTEAPSKNLENYCYEHTKNCTCTSLKHFVRAEMKNQIKPDEFDQEHFTEPSKRTEHFWARCFFIIFSTSMKEIILHSGKIF